LQTRWQLPGESADCQVVGNSDGTTDNLVVSVYTTLDDATENWDTVPLLSFELDCSDGNDNDISFIISGAYKFRLGFVRSGSTDTITTNAWQRKDGVKL
jgi:hypothetical protein